MLPWQWGSQRTKTKLHIVYKRVSQHFSTFMNFKKKDLSVINIYWVPFREELRLLVATKRLGHLQRHFNENVDHYKPSEENVKSKTLLKLFSKDFFRAHGEIFPRLCRTRTISIYWIFVLHLFWKEYTSIM